MEILKPGEEAEQCTGETIAENGTTSGNESKHMPDELTRSVQECAAMRTELAALRTDMTSAYREGVSLLREMATLQGRRLDQADALSMERIRTDTEREKTLAATEVEKQKASTAAKLERSRLRWEHIPAVLKYLLVGLILMGALLKGADLTGLLGPLLSLLGVPLVAPATP